MTQVKGFVAAGLVVGLTALTIAQAPQGTQSDGALRPRPGANREPEVPAPNIREYKPRSTLVLPPHPVPPAKFPVIDIHSHQPAPISAGQFDTLVSQTDGLNLLLLVNASGASGDTLVRSVAAIRESRYPDRMVMFAQISFRDVGPGYGQRAAQQLEADVKAGAVEFFQPLDYANERWLEMALYPDRRYPAPRYPSFEKLTGERDRLFKKHPKTTFIAAHMGWHANDLGRLARMFDEMPNVYGEVGAVLYDLGRQPRTAHEFLLKYQVRVLFGKDSYEPDEFPYFWRTFETADEYFDYHRDYHAFWKLNGLALPDGVLRKVYYGNALKLMPGVPRTGFPQ
jgi:predicted TIM-barrel fold metal-dependent hydrolase